jgi:hypothetical protein
LSEVDPDDWIQAFTVRLSNHYNYLVAKKPKLQKYLKGWMRRAVSVPGDA